MSELQRHKRSDKIKWVAVAVVLLLVVTAVVGMGLQLFGKGKTKPSEWFNKADKQIEQPANNDNAENADSNTDEPTEDIDTQSEVG